MIKTAGRVLKSNDVKLEGQIHLDAANPGSALPRPQVTAAATPQVRVTENHPDHAVIEVTCSCGTKLSVRCDYADAAAQNPDNPEA